jgi:hypothetical protein
LHAGAGQDGSPVPGMGHFNQALPGYSCQAPKPSLEKRQTAAITPLSRQRERLDGRNELLTGLSQTYSRCVSAVHFLSG